MLVIVDGANVVGSRPDGWWRDRAGAAKRLLDEMRAGGGQALEEAGREGDDLVLVLEGGARGAVEPGEHGAVTVVHAGASGDDEVVRLVAEADDGQEVLVVTADRGLRARVETLGARTQGPRWLWRRLGSG